MTKTYLLAACAAASLSCAANAATLISAAVFGSLGQTIWATANAPGTNAGNYTLFLQTPALGNFLNPNDQTIAYVPTAGSNEIFLAGDGFAPGTTLNSDPTYRLQLTFDNGAVLGGSYIPGNANTFIAGSPVTVGGTTFTLTEFSFTRNLADIVGPYQAVPMTGDPHDYSGNFSFTQSGQGSLGGAVPEPAQWAMLVSGFGLLGLGMRRRRSGAGTLVIA